MDRTTRERYCHFIVSLSYLCCVSVCKIGDRYRTTVMVYSVSYPRRVAFEVTKVLVPAVRRDVEAFVEGFNRRHFLFVTLQVATGREI